VTSEEAIEDDTDEDEDVDDDDSDSDEGGSEAIAAMSLETPSDYNMLTLIQQRDYKSVQRRRIGAVDEQEGDLQHMEMEEGDLRHNDMQQRLMERPFIERVRKESVGSVGSW